jgi:capsid protein
VRDVVEPERNLGHVDRDYPRKTGAKGRAGEEAEEQKKEETQEEARTGLPRPAEIAASAANLSQPQKEHCEDCA